MPKIILTSILIKFYFYFFFFDLKAISLLFFIFGLFSLIFGVFNAIYQYKLKRFLAYSAIANVGFILLAMSSVNVEVMLAILIYIFCYIVPVMLIFFILLNVRKLNPSFSEMLNIFELIFLNNNNNKFVKIFFVSLIFFSFAGIPPLIGFFGKFLLFFSVMNSHNFLVLIILLIFSIISAFYYVRIVNFFYF